MDTSQKKEVHIGNFATALKPRWLCDAHGKKGIYPNAAEADPAVVEAGGWVQSTYHHGMLPPHMMRLWRCASAGCEGV